MTDRQLTLTSFVSATLFSLVGATAVALAEPPAPSAPPMNPDASMRGVDGGLEIAVAVHAAESVGDMGGGMQASELVGSGTELDLQIGHRLTPHLAVSFYSTAQAFTSGGRASGRDVYTGAAGVALDVHTRPFHRFDPWISAGTGVRAVVVEDAGHAVRVGAELVRLQLGVDFRVNEDLAFGPVLSATASLYGAQKQPMMEFEELTEKGLHWVVSAGVAGRFNLLGSRR